jgi:hypothetical protein
MTISIEHQGLWVVSKAVRSHQNTGASGSCQRQFGVNRPLGIRLLCKAPGRQRTYHKGSGHASRKHHRYLRRMSPDTAPQRPKMTISIQQRDVWVVAKAVRNNQSSWVSYYCAKPPGARTHITRLWPCKPQASPL